VAVLLCSGDIRYYERLKQFYHVLIKYTLSQKKQFIWPWLLIITSAIVDRFTKFFHCQIMRKFCTVMT